MDNLKITIDQLKNYLGTGLKMRMKDHKIDYVGLEIDKMIGLHQWDKSGQLWCVLTEGGSKPAPSQVQPICYRLSDLDKFIPELGFVPLKRILNDKPEDNESIEIEKAEGRMAFQNRFRCFAWIDYENGESRKEHLADFPLHSTAMVPFNWMKKLFQWHFWPFGDEYFEARLVVDKLKLTT